MALLSLSLLFISILYLTYRHPPASWNFLPQWLRSREHQPVDLSENRDKQGGTTSSTHTTTDQSTAPSSDQVASEAQNAAVVQPLEDAAISPQEDRTPKAQPTTTGSSVPSFSLDESHLEEEEEEEEDERNMPPPMFPAANSAQRAGSMAAPPTFSAPNSASRVNGMAPPPKPSTGLGSSTSLGGSGLMPPPAPRPSTLRTPPSAPSSLRVPSTGPLPNRGPPQSSASTARTSPAPSTPTQNARKKILLKPGHSPLDWASLTRSGNLAGVPTFQRVTPSMLKYHNGRKGRPAWSSYLGKVYNITPYLPFHPGGEGELMRCAGKDGAKLFMEVHPWVNWENMLGSCLVGMMVPESDTDEGLEGMD